MHSRIKIEILFVLLIAAYAWLFQNEITAFYENLLSKIDPCPTPITYSIGQFDSQFKINEADFMSAIKEAEDIWEEASGRDLFSASTEGVLKISLVYDYRQESTTEINYLDDSLSQDNTYYLELKSQYEASASQYDKLKKELSGLVSSYKQKLAVYEKEVTEWNKKRGNQERYDQLKAKQQELEDLALIIKNKQVEVNNAASRINQLAEQLNNLANNLNLDIAKYNDVVGSTGQEFEQGNYIIGPDQREINIYQFENRDKLVRVLAHELGHALGIDHLDNPEDIMYSYNIGKSRVITANDLNELDRVCPVQAH